MKIIIGFLLVHLIVLAGAVRKTQLTWVNGIGYNEGHMIADAPQISRYFGGKTVDFYHNPTAMAHEDDMRGYYKDLTQAGTQKLGRITAEVNGLVQHLREALEQGALVTYLASKQLLPREMKQIEVLAFGGAAVLKSTLQTPFVRCVNYYSINDPLLFVVPSAEQALRSGFIADEFCFLAPRVGDPIADHHLLGPTYGSALAFEGRRFQRKYQSLAYRTMRPIILFVLALFHTIHQWLVTAAEMPIRLVVQRALVFHTMLRTLLERKRIADLHLAVPMPSEEQAIVVEGVK
ncbi:MAG: hypothetical protein SGARI_001028 [Bacillariaceae sp.]